MVSEKKIEMSDNEKEAIDDRQQADPNWWQEYTWPGHSSQIKNNIEMINGF